MSLVCYDILKFAKKAGESKIGKADILFLRAGATIRENIPVACGPEEFVYDDIAKSSSDICKTY